MPTTDKQVESAKLIKYFPKWIFIAFVLGEIAIGIMTLFTSGPDLVSSSINYGRSRAMGWLLYYPLILGILGLGIAKLRVRAVVMGQSKSQIIVPSWAKFAFFILLVLTILILFYYLPTLLD